MDDLLTWLRAEIRKDIAGAEKLLEEGPERRWYDRYHCVYPRDLIARGLAELALLALHEDVTHECVGDATGLLGMWEVCPTVRLLASGYRHRSGFKPSWLD